MERVFGRVVDDWCSYLGLGDAFAFFYDCIYFQPWTSSSGYGFMVYEQCKKGFFSWAYVEALLGQQEESDTYYYRVGCCPGIPQQDVLVARTVLLPGMKGTPEFDWYLQNVGSGREERKKLYERVTDLSKCVLSKTLDFDLLHLFHHQAGIPQVVKFTPPVFEHIA